MCAIRSIFLSGIPTGSHPHCHLVYNRVDNRGKAIPDGNDRYRNEKACKELTQKYGLYFSPGKECVNVDRLREPDKTRYQIYHAVKNVLPHCRSWPELENKLRKQGVTMRFKYNGHSDRMQGVLFSKNGRTFSGSKVDRAFSFSKLDHRFSQGKTQNRAQVPTAGTSSVRQPVAPVSLRSCIPRNDGRTIFGTIRRQTANDC